MSDSDPITEARLRAWCEEKRRECPAKLRLDAVEGSMEGAADDHDVLVEIKTQMAEVLRFMRDLYPALEQRVHVLETKQPVASQQVAAPAQAKPREDWRVKVMWSVAIACVAALTLPILNAAGDVIAARIFK